MLYHVVPGLQGSADRMCKYVYTGTMGKCPDFENILIPEGPSEYMVLHHIPVHSTQVYAVFTWNMFMISTSQTCAQSTPWCMVNCHYSVTCLLWVGVCSVRVFMRV